MKARPIDAYELELSRMLDKRSVEELDKFIVEHTEYYNKVFVADYLEAPELTKQITLCKMCANCKSVSRDTKKWALDWLKENGYDKQIRWTQFRYYGRTK